MKIFKLEEQQNIIDIKDKTDFINQVFQYITEICKKDDSFTINSKIKNLDDYYLSLKEKDNKLDKLIDRSNKIELDIKKQIHQIKEDNLKTKTRILEYLGR